jgi:Bacterial alpha-L-rhamnosidase C-terminal domain
MGRQVIELQDTFRCRTSWGSPAAAYRKCVWHLTVLLLLLSAAPAGAAAGTGQGLQPFDLTAEHATNPLDIDTIRGEISLDWVRSNHGLKLRVEIPSNTTAEVQIPADDPSSVTMTPHSGATFVRFEDGCAVYTVSSGIHIFQSELQR